jgi:pyruvate-formate lyase
MELHTRLTLLQNYRSERERKNDNSLGEATGRIYLPVPEVLKQAGKQATGTHGFLNLFQLMLDHSPVIIRQGELIVGNYYFQMPYELTLQNPPVDFEAIRARGGLPAVPSGHTSMDMPRGLALGWKGILENISQWRAKFGDGTPEADYLDVQVEVVRAIQDHIRAYAQEAFHLGESTQDLDQAREYLQIGERCQRMAEEAPLSFQDALQWFFFYLTFARATSNGLGGIRLDQVFYPFYLKDRQAGMLEDAEARLLLECVMLKEVPFSSIGGLTPDGKSAENELTPLVLDAYDEIGGTANLYLRWHKGIDPVYVERSAGILARHHSGTPSIANDEVIIPSLVHFNYPLQYARDYNFAGCFWWAVPGREYSIHDFAAINGVTALTRALKEARTAHWENFEDLWLAYAGYLEDAVNATMEAYAKIDPWIGRDYPEMVLSLLMDGCLEKGRDVNNNGVEFSLTTVMYVGLATVIDSLTAIRKRVFEEQLITLDQLLDALDQNFCGYEWIQQMLLSAPKYGNDLPEADEIAVRVANQFKGTLAEKQNSKGFGLRPAFYSYHRHTWEGEMTGATPDGRRAGAPLSQGGNPAHGRARQGITAALRSMTQIRYDDTAGCPVYIQLHGSDSSDLTETITSLINTGMQLGAVHLIINAVDSSTLWDAIDHPDQYADLTIRVTGYSAHFVQLDPRLQKEIAERGAY